MSAGAPRPLLRALAKLSLTGTVQLPKPSDFPPGVQWGGVKPPAAGFERFYNTTIRSMLTVPSAWHGYEFDQEFGNGIKASNVICAQEDIAKNGFFNTGVTLTIMTSADKGMLGQLAEGLRHTTLKELQKKLGGSSEWMHYGENAQICSLRYVSHAPEVQFHTGATAPAKNMIYVQDLFYDKEHGLIFRMKYESPEEHFNNSKKLFEGVKTCSYFALDDNGSNGLAFLEL